MIAYVINADKKRKLVTLTRKKMHSMGFILFPNTHLGVSVEIAWYDF